MGILFLSVSLKFPFDIFVRKFLKGVRGNLFPLKKVPPHFLSPYANLYCSL